MGKQNSKPAIAEYNSENFGKENLDYIYAMHESCIIAITDQKGIIKEVNSNFCEISKYSREELIGQDHRIINSGFHPKEFFRELWVTIANGKIWRGEVKNSAKDGTYYWVDTIVVPFLNEEGKPYKYLALRTDITERKKNEEEVAKVNIELARYQNELLNRNVAVNRSTAMTEYTIDGVIIEANDNFLAIFGYSLEQVKGKHHKFFVKPEFRETEEYNKFWEHLNNGNFHRGEFERIDSKGNSIWIEGSYNPIFDENGKLVKILKIVNDITFRKLADAKIKELNTTLEQKVEERTHQLVLANKELEAFSYSVSHDLRAPLRAVIGFAQILEEDYSELLNEEANQIIKDIKNSGARMGQLIDDLLNFSRLGRKELAFHIANLDDLVKEVCRILATTEPLRTIDFRMNELPKAKCDSNLVKQIWINLIGNAVKYTKTREKAIIEIGSETVGGEIVYYVKDNGVGFDMRFSNKLFGVFQRLHSQDEFEGTGVGLAIVHRIASRHGGRVWAESKLNEGATFYFTLKSL